ncbi:Planctomycete cytochrome C [Planctomycetes bacterium MalM25]|nr:Planctomycete cytochrome C [Planctomycetes bacterium MalM25]
MVLLWGLPGLASEPVDFDAEVRPIFTKHCTACHGGVKQAADLSFVYGDTVEYTIEAGSPDDSYLIERVIADDESRMPPPEHGPPLSADEVDLLKRWIELGAAWEAPWSYLAPQRHAMPETEDPDWARQPIDHFVLAKLEAEGVAPSPDERPDRWLRRVSLDLVGLPPSLEERAAFLKDLSATGEEAYATVVDRLLGSERFGERWASVWFDLVRYADSRGYGEDSTRDIWKYRDWVIDAFNADMPYDEFTTKQLAGDLFPERTLEDHLATAVHRLTHTNEEGGTDDEEFRVAAVIDRVSTTWQTWMGVTIGCVQCHSHPYDPIEHEDFYRSAAYFNNTADVDLSDDWPLLDVPIKQEDYVLATELDRRITRAKLEAWEQRWRAAHLDTDWTPTRIDSVRSSTATEVGVDKKDDHDDYRTSGTVAKHSDFELTLPIEPTDKPITGVKVVASPLDPETALPDAEVGFVLSRIQLAILPKDAKKPVDVPIRRIVGDEPLPRYDASNSLRDNNEGFGAYTRVNHPREAVLIPKEPIQLEPGSRLVVKLRHRVFNLAAFVLVTRRGSVEYTTDEELPTRLEDETLTELDEQIKGLQAARDQIESVPTPILQERPDHLARPTHQFIRGLFLTKGEQVAAGVPASMIGAEDQPSSRLELAEWLVSEGNPLTSRVAVNRFWSRLWGIGLVATEEDFGAAGDRPSHPALLDDLAVRFREDYGWSVKRLLREITLSRAYRQESKLRPELIERDPLNRLLAHGPRHSLPAETLRDQMLAVSGLLTTKMHGPPVYPPLPRGVWKARRGSWPTAPVGNPDRYRRSVYTFIKRSVPHPAFAAFDAPSRDYCIAKRQRSNTPLQPLMLLNDTAFVECAEALADRMREHPGELSEQIAYGFSRATCREPRDNEVEQLNKLHSEVLASDGEKIALQTVAAVLLNLDEIITK